MGYVDESGQIHRGTDDDDYRPRPRKRKRARVRPEANRGQLLGGLLVVLVVGLIVGVIWLFSSGTVARWFDPGPMKPRLVRHEFNTAMFGNNSMNVVVKNDGGSGWIRVVVSEYRVMDRLMLRSWEKRVNLGWWQEQNIQIELPGHTIFPPPPHPVGAQHTHGLNVTRSVVWREPQKQRQVFQENTVARINERGEIIRDDDDDARDAGLPIPEPPPSNYSPPPVPQPRKGNPLIGLLAALGVLIGVWNFCCMPMFGWLASFFNSSVTQTAPAQEYTNAIGMKFRRILLPNETFLMGSPENEASRDRSEQQYRVKLTKGFVMGVYPVTQGQWEAIMQHNPSKFKQGQEYPVENVSWNDCQEFLRRMSQLDGKQYRLPTEAEWEYACAGTKTAFSCGNTLTPGQANCKNAYKGTTPVGRFPPNPWGLYDMHGNVWQWCSDWFGEYPKTNLLKQEDYVVDPRGGAVGVFRVARGGSWNSETWSCRSASRGNWNNPKNRYNNVGFRVCYQD